MKASAESKTIFPYEVAESVEPEYFITGSYSGQSETASHSKEFATDDQTINQHIEAIGSYTRGKRIYLSTGSSTSKHILSDLNFAQTSGWMHPAV